MTTARNPEHSDDSLAEELQAAVGDQFTLIREIGRGGMATVYLAEEKHPARQVAIKVLDPDVTTRLTRRRFLREVELVSNLAHPNIVPIYSAGNEGDLLYYVMPYIEGETLRERIGNGGPLSLDEAIPIVRDVAAALDHAHEKGIAHRDIKPENILISGGHAVVADFGVARAITCAECGDEVQPLTRAGLPIGTPMYMSPEQAAGDPEIDGRTDIYSLGCVLYEMITGRQPYHGDTMYDIINAHSRDPVPTPKTPQGTAPRFVRKAITTAMSKRPKDRFDCAGDLVKALTEPGADSSPGFSGRTRNALVAAGIAGLAAAGWWLMKNRPNRAPEPPRVVVAAFLNQTGDHELDGLGPRAADRITRGLIDNGVVRVASLGAHVTMGVGADTDQEVTRRAEQAGADAIIWGAYYVNRDSLHFLTQVTRTRDRTLLVSVESAVGAIDAAENVLRILADNVNDSMDSAFGPVGGR